MIPAYVQPDAGPAVAETHRLGLAELGYRGLSEQWLMRRAGDLHWRLIADAMGQREPAFVCAEGKPLYAAFCVSSLRLRDPTAPRINGVLDLSARLWRLGRTRLVSEQAVCLERRQIGRIRLVSTFVGRETAGSNRSIVRRMPRIMALPPEAPDSLALFAARGGRVAAALPTLQPSSWPAQRRADLLPCPATDFNAVGLLYFPSFAALTERADFAKGGAHDRLLRARDVIYTGNVEPGEGVEITFRDGRCGHLSHIAGSDGRPLALLRSQFVHA